MPLGGKLFKALANPVLALTGSRILNYIFNPHALLKRLLTPKVPRTGSLSTAEQFADLRAQNNQARIGEPKTVLKGRTQFYPTLIQQPWSEYVNNSQVLHLRMHVTVGRAMLLQLNSGDAPLSTFAGSTYQLLQPGEAMTQFHPNVYVSERLQGVELVAGILKTLSYTGEIVFSGARLRVANDAASIAARAAAKVNPFVGIEDGNDVIVSGSVFNDGNYECIAFDGSNPVDFVDVENNDGSPVTFVDETAPVCTISYGAFFEDGASTPRLIDIPITFDNTLAEVRSGPFAGDAVPLHRFLPGDIITFTGTAAGTNRYEPFTVVAQSDTGLILSPPPESRTGTVKVFLLRRYYGPYPVCPPGDVVDRVAFDLVWPQGIGSRGGERQTTMRFSPEYQTIDDTGTPTSGWISFGRLSVTAASRNPQRRTYEYPLPVPARVQLRLARTNIDSDDSDVLDTVQWTGARGFIVARPGELPEIDPLCTTLAVSLRNTAALSAAEEQRINGVFQREVETWSALSGWGPAVASNSAVWAALDELRGPEVARGRQIPDRELDLPAFAALDAALAAEGVEFNGQISVAGNLRDNVNRILQVGRAELRHQLRNGKFGVVRDVPSDPVQLFADHNAEITGYQRRLRAANDATGAQVSYIEPAFNDEGLVGIGNTDEKPLRVDLRNGCTSRELAWREVNFAWNEERFRRRTITVNAELEPLVLNRGDRVLLQCAERGWGQSAMVVSVGGRAITVSPPLDWSGTGHGVRLRDPYGVPGALIACTRDGADDRLLLDADADVEFTGDNSGEQRTILSFESSAGAPVIAIVNDIRWQASRNGLGHVAALSCTIDDPRVHADPGPAPPDPYAPVIALPSLVIVGLELGNSSGTITAAWIDLPAAILYTTEWRYTGSLTWTVAARGTAAVAVFTVPVGGTVEVRVRAFGSGGVSGPYATASIIVPVGSTGAAALAISVTPLALFASVTGSSATTAAASASASGGTPPYTFAWLRFSGDADITAATPAAAATVFTHTALATGETSEASFRVTVTDAAAATARSALVVVTVVNTADGGTPGGGPAAPDGTAYRATNDGGLRLTNDGGTRVPHLE